MATNTGWLSLSDGRQACLEHLNEHRRSRPDTQQDLQYRQELYRDMCQLAIGAPTQVTHV